MQSTQVYFDDRDVAEWEVNNASSESASVELPDLTDDEIGLYYTHHVTVVGLEPDTKYDFMVGTGNFFYRATDHDGANEFTTAAIADEIDTPDPAYGKIVATGETMSDLIPVVDANVYFYVENSFGDVLTNRISATLNDEGSWYLDLNTLYDSEGEVFFSTIPEEETELYKEVVEVHVPSGDIYMKRISPSEDTPAEDMLLIEDYKVEKAIEGEPPLSGLASSAYAWDLTCPNGKKLHADAADEASFIAVYGASQAQSKWEQEASGYCGDPNTPSWQEGQPTVQLTDEVCAVTYTETGAFGSNDGCEYNCVGMGHRTIGGDCKNEWGNGSYCQKKDPNCGTVCVGGEVCKQGDFCISGDYQCCTAGCNVRGSEGGSSGSGNGSGTPTNPSVCPNKKPDNATERCGEDNVCNTGEWCGDLNGVSCKCGEGTVECGMVCTQSISEGKVAVKVCCLYHGVPSLLTNYTGECPIGWQEGTQNQCKTTAGTLPTEPVCCKPPSGEDIWMYTPSGQCEAPLVSSTCPAKPKPVPLPINQSTPAPVVTSGSEYTNTCTVEPNQRCGDCKGQVGEANGITYMCTDIGAGSFLYWWKAVVPAGERCPDGNECICVTRGGDGSIEHYSGDHNCNSLAQPAGSLTPIGNNQQCPADSNGCFCDTQNGYIYPGSWCGYAVSCDANNVGSVCNNDGTTCEFTEGQTATYTTLGGDTKTMPWDECQNTPECINGYPQVRSGEYTCTGPTASSLDNGSDLISEASTAVLGAGTGRSVKVSPQNNAVAIDDSGIYCTAVDAQEYCFELTDAAENILYADLNGNNTYEEGTDLLVSQDGRELELQQQNTTFDYQMVKGFNFVSFPFVNASYMATASDLLTYLNSEYSNGFYSIAKFEAGRWRIVGNREGDNYGSEDFPLVPGEGYLFKANLDILISLSGQRITEPVPVYIATGWNLIGVNSGSDESKYTAESLIDDVNSTEGLTAVNLSRWSTSKARYEGLQKEDVDGTAQVYGFDFPVDNRSSYFLRIVEGEGLWTPDAQ
ncbi:MAG: fibronectin type III domain-containing protein [Candidatus Dojkabacteria bacterium]|nr:MAG: fibronectin type III domain-containing protein [Candidatus Dojkabacteria bacterium]